MKNLIIILALILTSIAYSSSAQSGKKAKLLGVYTIQIKDRAHGWDSDTTTVQLYEAGKHLIVYYQDASSQRFAKSEFKKTKNGYEQKYISYLVDTHSHYILLTPSNVEFHYSK